ncbi:PDZ domain-containing protein [Maricaulaceae bacterium NA33B04]|nr:PDZ domain-containing protein [Maricaulaceae bacterium NA33B04]
MAADHLTQSASSRPTSAASLSKWIARGVELALVAMLAFWAAQAVWFVTYGDAVRPLDISTSTAQAGGSTSRVSDLSVLTGMSLFAASAHMEEAGPQVVPETRLNLSLSGVRAGSDPRSGAAFIEAPNTGQRSYAPGDEIATGVTLEEIYGDRVIISRGGSRESLFISQEAAERARNATPDVATPPSSTAAINASPLSGQPDLELARSLDVEDWVEGLRLAPRFEDGQITGLRVRDNSHLEILRASGLQPGDIIIALNGQRLTSLEAAQRALSSLETVDRLSLSLERNDAPVQIDVPLN